MARAAHIKVLVTGFGPFPGIVSNPSAELIGWIETGKIRLPRNIELKSELIATGWSAAEEFVSGTLSAFDPDVALHFGVHSRARGLRLEAVAQNAICQQPDAFGKTAPSIRVSNAAPRALRSSFGAEKLVASLRARGLRADTSRDAGKYLCNALLLLSLHQAQGRYPARVTGFVHIPPLGKCGSGKRNLLVGAECIIRECISQVNHARLAAAV